MAIPAAGMKILASHFSAAWTAYTPSWTASAGAVAVGNGSLSGRYFQLGKTVQFSMQLTAGTTTTYGTAGAFWTFGLPALGNTAAAHAWAARLLDAATLEYAGIASCASGVAVFDLFKPVSGRIVNNSPFTFGTSDSLWVSGTYEIA